MPTRFPVFFRESQAMPSRGGEGEPLEVFFSSIPALSRCQPPQHPTASPPRVPQQLQTPSRRGSRGGVAVGAVETLLGGGRCTKAFLSAAPRLSPVPVFVPVFSFLGR